LKTGATEWIKWNEGIDVAKVNRIVKSPNGEIFAAMSNGLFTSQDNGRTWNEIYKRHTTSLALDGGKIFAGNDSGDILFSTDKLEWNRRPSAISRTSTYVYSIAFKDSVLLSSFRGRVRSWYGGILEYDDGRVDRFPQQNVAEWKFPRGNNITLFNDFKDFFTVESGTLYGSQSFVKSSHDGIDWKIIFSGPKVNDIHFSFSNKPYIATDSGIYRRDGETVFTKLNFPFKTTALATAKDGIMYAASDSAIYRSDDEWKNWEDVSKGIRGKVSNLAVTQDGHIVAGTAENGLFVSSERTYSVLKVADFIRECGRHTITIQGDSLHDFKSIIADNASIEILNDESASVLTVRILQSDHLKPGEYSFTISDILGRKLEFGNSLPQINFPRIIQGGDTLRTNIHARAYQWFKDSSPVNGATHEFLKIRQSGTYSLKVTDTNHCEITSEPFVAIASSVHAFKNYGGFTSQFLPMENAVVVKLPESLLGEISITDQMGNIIFKKNIETTGTSYRILARDFPQGMYYICFKTGFLSLQDRFVIVRY
ncbi:MAG TPA: hypothetical protein VEC36_11935, partial [Patescibacteria group bacterium]|nr:hypothetical protein [Patescibacteria group bacterium]